MRSVRGNVFRLQVEVLESRCLMSTFAHPYPGGPVNLDETVPINIVFGGAPGTAVYTVVDGAGVVVLAGQEE